MPLIYRLNSRPALGRILMSLTMRPALERGIKRLFYNSEVLSQDMFDIALTNSRRPGARDALLNILKHNVGLRGLHSEVVMTERLPQIKVPTLFIHGAQDVVFPLKHVKGAFDMMPNSRVKIFDRCGHCPHIERVVEFNETVMAFIEGN